MRGEVIVGELSVRQARHHAIGKPPDFIIQTQGRLYIGAISTTGRRCVSAISAIQRWSAAGKFAVGADAGFNRQRVSVLFRHDGIMTSGYLPKPIWEGNPMIFNSETSTIRPGFANPYRKGQCFGQKCNELDT